MRRHQHPARREAGEGAGGYADDAIHEPVGGSARNCVAEGEVAATVVVEIGCASHFPVWRQDDDVCLGECLDRKSVV